MTLRHPVLRGVDTAPAPPVSEMTAGGIWDVPDRHLDGRPHLDITSREWDVMRLPNALVTVPMGDERRVELDGWGWHRDQPVLAQLVSPSATLRSGLLAQLGLCPKRREIPEAILGGLKHAHLIDVRGLVQDQLLEAKPVCVFHDLGQRLR